MRQKIQAAIVQMVHKEMTWIVPAVRPSKIVVELLWMQVQSFLREFICTELSITSSERRLT